MSYTATKQTQYHDAPQPVKFKLAWVRLDAVDNPANLQINAGLNGRIGNAAGVVESVHKIATLDELKAEFTTAEKTAAKTFLAAIERLMSKKVADLADQTQDKTDVFVTT